MARISTEDKLSVNKFYTDEEYAHIMVCRNYPDGEEVDRVVRICPAGIYKQGKDGSVTLGYLGCLECGTCRILSAGKVVAEWNYPQGGLGVEFRQG